MSSNLRKLGTEAVYERDFSGIVNAFSGHASQWPPGIIAPPLTRKQPRPNPCKDRLESSASDGLWEVGQAVSGQARSHQTRPGRARLLRQHGRNSMSAVRCISRVRRDKLGDREDERDVVQAGQSAVTLVTAQLTSFVLHQ